MSNISDWSTTASNNNSTPPNGAPEGCAPSAVNDIIREVMAAVRRWYEDAAWIDYGYTYTRIGGDSFSIVGDHTATHHAGRRVKMSGSATAYGTISESTYSSPDTTITISEANVPATLDSVALSVITRANSPMPYNVTDYARVSASNVFTGTLNTLSSTTPTLRFLETDAATDEQYWRIVTTGGLFAIQALPDSYSGGNTAFSINRNGDEPTTFTFSTTTGIATMGSVGQWSFTNGTVTGNLSYSVVPTFQIGTTSNHALDLYTNSTTRMTVRADGVITSQSFTVATLPSAISSGRAFVTDATSTTFASIVAGGGSNRVPVYSDGTNWRIG